MKEALTKDSHELNLEELMARPSKRVIRQIKFKFYLALFISNFALFMLMSPTENKSHIKTISTAPDHIVLRLPLNLMLPLIGQEKTHVTLVDHAQRVHVANAWIWQEDTVNNDNSLPDTQRKFYSVELRPSDATHLLKKNLEENVLMAIPPIPMPQAKKEHPYVEIFL